MSTLAYGALTRKREDAPAETSTDTNPPGVKTYVDALAALVPAEVLVAHSIVIGYATEVADDVTTITAPDQLAAFFWFFAALCPVLFLVGLQKIPTGWDYARMFVPSVAFLGWTLLQPATAFDGIQSWVKGFLPWFSADWRWTYGIMIAIVVGIVAGLLGLVADKEPPNPPVPEPEV